MKYKFQVKPLTDCNDTALKEGQIVSYPVRAGSRMWINIGCVVTVQPAKGYISVQRRQLTGKFETKQVRVWRTDRVSVLEQPTVANIVGTYKGVTFTGNLKTSWADWTAQQQLDMATENYRKATEQWKKEQNELRKRLALSSQHNGKLIYGGLSDGHQTL